MRSSFACLTLMVLAISGHARAEDSPGESCDNEARVKLTKGGARFVQLVTCGDGTAGLTLVCKKGSKTIDAVIPYEPVGAAIGEKLIAKIKLPKQTVSKKAEIVAAVPGGSLERSAKIKMTADEPLWAAFASAGTDIYAVEDGDATQWMGVSSGSAAAIGKFKTACGL